MEVVKIILKKPFNKHPYSETTSAMIYISNKIKTFLMNNASICNVRVESRINLVSLLHKKVTS